MTYLPSDPVMLLSMLNMKLRDSYSSLEDLCDDLDYDRGEIEAKMQAAGFLYNPDTNQFR